MSCSNLLFSTEWWKDRTRHNKNEENSQCVKILSGSAFMLVHHRSGVAWLLISILVFPVIFFFFLIHCTFIIDGNLFKQKQTLLSTCRQRGYKHDCITSCPFPLNFVFSNNFGKTARPRSPRNLKQNRVGKSLFRAIRTTFLDIIYVLNWRGHFYYHLSHIRNNEHKSKIVWNYCHTLYCKTWFCWNRQDLLMWLM